MPVGQGVYRCEAGEHKGPKVGTMGTVQGKVGVSTESEGKKEELRSEKWGRHRQILVSCLNKTGWK